MKKTLSLRSKLTVPAIVMTLLIALPAIAAAPLSLSEKMAVAEASVQQANTTSNAENAANELQVATTKLMSARKALADRDYLRAEQLAEEAQVDALVAQRHAEAERSRKAAQESQDAAWVLSEEINRPTAR
jgi:lactam utilization protein B